MNANQMAVCAFLMNTAYNMCTDESNDPFMTKLTRSALNSIPATLAIDTRNIVKFAANKLNINNIQQPETSVQSWQKTMMQSTKTLEDYVKEKNMPAYYSKPEVMYKNFA